MPIMSRADAIQRLSEIYDQLEAAERSANQPEVQLQLEDEVHTLFQRLTVGVIGQIRSRRHGAAMVARHPFDLTVADPQAIAAGQLTWGQATLRTSAGAAAARRVLARAVMDDPALPPHLALEIATALFRLNLGDGNTWLGKPLRSKGFKSGHAYRFYVGLACLLRVYYHTGYHSLSLPEAAAVVLAKDTEGRQWSALEQMRRRENLGELCVTEKRNGEWDKTRGAAYCPSLALDYDLASLESLRR